MKKILLAIVLVCVLAAGAAAQNRGLQLIAAQDFGPQVQVGKQWAVFIAIDRYVEWPPLANPVKDAREIRNILTENYFIDEVRELYNNDATVGNIRRLFADLRRDVKNDDSVFVFYAGHGYTDDLTRSGSWIPTDGGRDEMVQANWLPNIQIRNMLSQLAAKHVFLIADACFSGDILDTSRGAAPTIDSEYHRRAYSRVSRQVMTSGASEEVPDASEFAMRLKSSLSRATTAYVDPEFLFTSVRQVRTTQPLLGTIRGSEHEQGGSFIFFRKRTEQEPETLAAVPVPGAQAVTPLPPAQGQVRPSAPQPQQQKKEKEDFAYNNFWSVGAMVGSTFSTPAGTATLTGTLPFDFVIPYTFFDLGFEAGFLDTVNNSDNYYCFYPYAHFNVFIPLIDNRIMPYAGVGAGYMMSNYEYPGETKNLSYLALDAVAGFKLFGFIDIGYSLRVNLDGMGMGSRLALGAFYQFK